MYGPAHADGHVNPSSTGGDAQCADVLGIKAIQKTPVLILEKYTGVCSRGFGIETKLKEGLYRIQILCRRHPFWSYHAGLTIADPPD